MKFNKILHGIAIDTIGTLPPVMVQSSKKSKSQNVVMILVITILGFITLKKLKFLK